MERAGRIETGAYMEYKKNSQVEIEITDTGVSGEGIGKIDGFTLFVKDAVQGDKVLALLTKVKRIMHMQDVRRYLYLLLFA